MRTDRLTYLSSCNLTTAARVKDIGGMDTKGHIGTWSQWTSGVDPNRNDPNAAQFSRMLGNCDGSIIEGSVDSGRSLAPNEQNKL